MTKFGSKPLNIELNAMEITKKRGGYRFSGGQTHLVHDTKWEGGGWSSQIFQIPT